MATKKDETNTLDTTPTKNKWDFSNDPPKTVAVKESDQPWSLEVDTKKEKTFTKKTEVAPPPEPKVVKPLPEPKAVKHPPEKKVVGYKCSKCGKVHPTKPMIISSYTISSDPTYSPGTCLCGSYDFEMIEE